MKKYFLAIDIGASSGRHIVGWREGETLQTKEVYRFPNGVQEENGHLVWNIDSLVDHVKEGIDTALSEFGSLTSLSVDTWGVDYVLLRRDQEISPCYAYRDGRTNPIIPAVHEQIPFEELYARTGCQFQPFNTIYQLWDDLNRGRLQGVTDFLMIPEYLLWKLTGTKAKEYTNATTTGLVSAQTGAFDSELTKQLRLPDHLFPPLWQPGTPVGTYKGIKAVLCATHDTASAVEGIPMEGNQPYLSSGTWSLLGMKVPAPFTDEGSRIGNWSNEGGIGYIRYQKNIMGMWIINRLRDALCPNSSFSDIVREAESSHFDETVDVNSSGFLAPDSMKAAFDGALDITPQSIGDYFRCAYRSLAFSYAAAIRELEENTGKTYKALYIVGGGAKNQFLNRLTAEASGKEIVALPIEATAFGNLNIQMEANQ